MKEYKLKFKLENIQEIAKEFLNICSEKKIFAFYGSMGAGKTTFITALCKQLKSTDLVSSPTFSIVNEYLTENNFSIFHCDFYRINTINELHDIGFDEYLTGDNYCFVEWPEKAEEALDEEFIKVKLIELHHGFRELHFWV